VERRPGARGVPETVTKGRSLPASSSPRVARAALSSATAFARASGLLKSLPHPLIGCLRIDPSLVTAAEIYGK
jgi:hypothetical protein